MERKILTAGLVLMATVGARRCAPSGAHIVRARSQRERVRLRRARPGCGGRVRVRGRERRAPSPGDCRSPKSEALRDRKRIWSASKKGRRRRTLPQSLLCSTIRATRLNDRVRDGNGCDPRAIDADQDEKGVWGAATTESVRSVGEVVEEGPQKKCGLIKPHGRLVPLG